MKHKFFWGIIIGALCLLSLSIAHASPFTANHQGDAILSNSPAYDWWYGCSPTSAGMMMAYYDINGYGGLSYNNLVNGTASLDFQDQNARDAIASKGHIDHFYSGNMNDNYLKSKDDSPGRTGSDFNSLADFMGTSQDAYGNANGSTTFINYTNGSRFYAADAVNFGLEDRSGMYGIMEYIHWSGYGVSDIYNQYIDTVGLTYGFSFDDYKNEIDADRVVMIHVEGHSMFGYGYDDFGNIIFHDTWNDSPHSMSWGSSYSGLDMYGVTAFTLTGGSQPVPEPATLLLFATGLAGLVGIRKKK